jgi:hypothetical protein
MRHVRLCAAVLAARLEQRLAPRVTDVCAPVEYYAALASMGHLVLYELIATTDVNGARVTGPVTMQPEDKLQTSYIIRRFVSVASLILFVCYVFIHPLCSVHVECPSRKKMWQARLL